MNTNVYAHKSGPLSKAFLQVVGLTDGKLVEVADQKSAELVLLLDSDDIRSIYNDRQLFCVLLTGQQRRVAAQQPENICFLNTLELFKGTGGIMELLAMIKKRQATPTARIPEVALPKFSNIATFEKFYKVLVIDDTEKNLRIAEAVLVGHTVVTANRLKQAVELMSSQRFDAVLTDMEMLPDKLYGALNLDNYGMTETVPYGFAAIFEATEHGLPVAVVTDGNHHAGWVSAMFDVRKGATVNGQKVLFFNNIGKRWDEALKSLMEK